MLARLLSLILIVPLGILLVTLAVTNRHEVNLVLDPFRPQDPALALELPFSAFLLISLLIGILAGGFAVWLRQGRWRRAARVRSDEARRWQAEADRLTRERDEQLHSSRSNELVPANR